MQLMWPSAGALVSQPITRKLRRCRLPKRRASCSLRRPMQGPKRTQLDSLRAQPISRSERIRSPASWPAWPPLQAKHFFSLDTVTSNLRSGESRESGSRTRSWLLVRLLKAFRRVQVATLGVSSSPPSADSRPCQAGGFSIWLWTPCYYNRYRGAGASKEPSPVQQDAAAVLRGLALQGLEGSAVRVTWIDVYRFVIFSTRRL